MLKRTIMPRMASLALLFMLALAGCGTLAPATTSTPSTNISGTQVATTQAPVLTDLHGPDELKAQFNKDSGMPRLILLVSPT